MTGLLIDDIATLVTNDPSVGEGPLGTVRDAALVFGDGGGEVGRTAFGDS